MLQKVMFKPFGSIRNGRIAGGSFTAEWVKDGNSVGREVSACDFGHRDAI